MLFVITFALSISITFLLIKYQHLHEKISQDDSLSLKPQRFHNHPVSRIGGIGIYFALFIIGIIQYINIYSFNLFTNILLCSFPAFAIGLWEDISKKISVTKRFGGIAMSAYLFATLLDTKITSIDIVFIDFLLSVPIASLMFTCFAIVGLTM